MPTLTLDGTCRGCPCFHEDHGTCAEAERLGLDDVSPDDPDASPDWCPARGDGLTILQPG